MSSKNKTVNTQNKFKDFLVRYAAQLAFLVGLIIILSIVTTTFMTKRNIVNVMRQISATAYMSCAMTMILITGGIDLSVGAIVALAGMVCCFTAEAGVPFIFCALGALACGLLVGLFNGVMISSTTLPPFIVTYSVCSIVRGIVYLITNAQSVRLTNEAFLNFGNGVLLDGWLPYPVLYLVLVVFVTWLILERSKLGRKMFAIGGSEKAAKYAGINVRRVRLFIYVASGLLAALAGLVITSRNSSMQAQVAEGIEMDCIAAVVLGGTSMAGGLGSIWGTLIGALIIGVINNGLNLMGVSSFWQFVVRGCIILLAVYLDFLKSLKLDASAIAKREKKQKYKEEQAAKN